MPRPAATDAALTKLDILTSARIRFAQVGFDGTSIRDVARTADCTLGTVHHYFGTKEGLYQACFDSVYEEISALRRQLAIELSDGGSAEDLVRRAVVTTYRFAREHQVAVRLLVRAAVQQGELLPRGREELMAFLDTASRGLAAIAGRRPTELRLPLQSIVFLVARYAVQSDAELVAVAGANERTVHARVERHLVDVASRVVLGTSDSTHH